VVGRRKSSDLFWRLVLFARYRGVEKPGRKDSDGQAKRVRMGGIVVEGLLASLGFGTISETTLYFVLKKLKYIEINIIEALKRKTRIYQA